LRVSGLAEKPGVALRTFDAAALETPARQQRSNPSTWDWDNLWGLNQAKANGIQTMLIADYTPPWLSYSGGRTGVPDNWSVGEDIVAKTYERYAADIGWVEVWNEPDLGTLDLSGSPYTTKEAAIAAIYYYTAQAIRSTGSTVPIGGPAFAGNNTGSLNTILQDLVAAHGEAWVQQNLDFYSFHDYGADPGGAFSAAAIRSVFTANGLSAKAARGA
jgi:Glycosyl hydrolases family 39